MTQHMAGFVRVAQVSELAPGEMKWVVANRQRLLLANVGGTFYAISDQCGHERASLSQGRLDGQEVECPRHYAKFDVRTGKLTSGPRTFPRTSLGWKAISCTFKRNMRPAGNANMAMSFK